MTTPSPRQSDDPAQSAALEAGRLLFAGECRFIMGVAELTGLPPMGLPEVAFAGRSNVGKSSLIDALHGLKDSDEALMKRLDKAAVTYQAVLTKTDKLTSQALAARRATLDQALRRHPAAHPELIATSALTGVGIPALRAALAALA